MTELYSVFQMKSDEENNEVWQQELAVARESGMSGSSQKHKMSIEGIVAYKNNWTLIPNLYHK